MVSVTHRLRSVLTMDKIYVLDQGRVVEDGSHAELIEKGGVYAKMWQKQSGVRLEDGDSKATVDVSWLADLPLLKGVRPERLAEIAKWFGT
jgi:energy-coupling factor transporter ATP-binding protein EcfA2